MVAVVGKETVVSFQLSVAVAVSVLKLPVTTRNSKPKTQELKGGVQTFKKQKNRPLGKAV